MKGIGRQIQAKVRASGTGLVELVGVSDRARACVERRRAEGRAYRDAIRALKRHLSEVVYQKLRADAGRDTASPLTQELI